MLTPCYVMKAWLYVHWALTVMQCNEVVVYVFFVFKCVDGHTSDHRTNTIALCYTIHHSEIHHIALLAPLLGSKGCVVAIGVPCQRQTRWANDVSL